MKRHCVLAFALAVIATVPAAAQDLPAQVGWRYDEDWSVLRDRNPAALPDWIPAKYRPLSADGSSWISTGVEARARYEGYQNNLWGSAPAPDDGYLWLRLMPHADIHAGPVRAFVQGIAGYVVGLETPPGPADQTGVDLLQGFGEAVVPVGDAMVTLRGGRELISLGSERLVGTRYGPNIPQPFDGVHVIADVAPIRLQLMRVDPVAIGPGNFDDHASDTRSLTGAYATLQPGGTGVDAYVLDFRNRNAQFEQGTGDEHRQTVGVRVFGERGPWSWNWELMEQFGRFSGEPIRAWSLGTETAYRIEPVTFRLRADIISGDHDAADHVLQTFNPMFPKGKYFGELTPLGPSNIVNVHPGIDFDLGHNLTIGFAAIAYWRQSRGDGIYGIAGNLLRAGNRSDALHIGDQQEVVLNWHPHPLVNVLASYSLFEPGEFIRQTGPAQTIHMIGFEVMYRL
nr:alginate export family protein [Bradyrhizobium tropiciagri]